MRDIYGLKRLYKLLLQMSSIIAILILNVLIIFSDQIARFYTTHEEIQPLIRDNTKYLALYLSVDCVKTTM